jgi:hypothetical protein
MDADNINQGMTFGGLGKVYPVTSHVGPDGEYRFLELLFL